MHDVVNLNNLDGIPLSFIAKLKIWEKEFQGNDYLESVMEIPEIYDLVIQINNYCLNRKIVGFHYTRANEDQISLHGLRCRSGEEIRDTFLSSYGHKFTTAEITLINHLWNSYFDRQAKNNRDNVLFFNFTTSAILDFGAAPLLQNYGGEQIYMPLQENEFITQKIKSLGEPMIVKCRLNPRILKTYRQYPWGRIAVSTYHKRINPLAVREDQDGNQKSNVKPQDLDIIRFDPTHKYHEL